MLALINGKNCSNKFVLSDIAIILAIAESNFRNLFLRMHVSVSKWYHIKVLLTPFVIRQQTALKTVKNEAVAPQNLKSAHQIFEANLTANQGIFSSIWTGRLSLILKLRNEPNCPHSTVLSINLVVL